MTALLIIAVVVLALIGIAGIIGLIGSAVMCAEDVKIGALLFVVSLLVCAGAVVGIVFTSAAAARHINAPACQRFGEQSGYETRLLVVNAVDDGTCMALIGDHWVPTDGIRTVASPS